MRWLLHIADDGTQAVLCTDQWLDNTIWLLNESGLPLSPAQQRYVDSLQPLS